MTDQLLNKAHQLEERDEARTELEQWRSGTRITKETSDRFDQHRAAEEEISALRQDLDDALANRLAIEQILDSALGPNAEDGTGEGIAADVAYLVRQRDEARAQVQALRERARQVQEDTHEDYAAHRADLIKALGQHSDPASLTLRQLIEGDVAALAQGYDTIEDELIEWRTGQRAVEASAVQWVEIRATLDQTLAAVRELAGHLGSEGHMQGQLVDEEPFFPSTGQRASGTDLDGRPVVGTIGGFFAWNSETNTNERVGLTLDDGVETVVTVASLKPEQAAEPLQFTHDTEE